MLQHVKEEHELTYFSLLKRNIKTLLQQGKEKHENMLQHAKRDMKHVAAC